MIGAALGGCGGGGGGAVTSIPLAQFASRLIDASCARQVACGEAADVASCRGAALVQQQQQWMADVQGGLSIYDPAAAAACVNSLEATDGLGSCSQPVRASAEPPAACREVFKGTAALGAACIFGSECQSANCERASCTDRCCTGTCAAALPDPVAAGGDCSGTLRCAHGTYCKVSASGSICAVELAQGEACVSSSECAPGTFCDHSAGATGTCARFPLTGETCLTICDSVADLCDLANTQKCIPRAAVGSPCSPAGECVAYARCDTVTMNCLARAKAGQACTNSSDCLSGLLCTAGKCALPAQDPACPVVAI